MNSQSEHIDRAAKIAAQSRLVSRNVTVNGRRTSVRLEPEMWNALRSIARLENMNIHELCTLVYEGRENETSFTAALRVFLMAYFRYRPPECNVAQAS